MLPEKNIFGKTSYDILQAFGYPTESAWLFKISTSKPDSYD